MATILLLGSDRSLAREVRSILREDGHEVELLRSVERWRDRERALFPELVVAAVDSPDAVLRKPGPPVRGFPAPLLFVRRDADLYRQLDTDERLVDRIESPFMSEDLLARADALIRARRVVRRSGPAGEDEDPTPTRPGSFRRRMAAILGPRLPKYEKPIAPYAEVALRIAEWTDQRDVFTPGHTERVASLAAIIGEAFGLPDDETATLVRAAMLHDIGKVALPGEVLRAKGPLREDQRRLIRSHPQKGASLLRALKVDEAIARAIHCHHEQPDGDGYYGKTAEHIPRSAAILAAAEAYDAMTSSRLRPPLSKQAALEKLGSESGWKYDADCVSAIVDALGPRRTTLPLSAPTRRTPRI